MMKYRLFFSRASAQYLEIELRMPVVAGRITELVLPYWRPGRYEGGNFAKNVKSFGVFDPEGRPVSFSKSSMNRWVLNPVEGISEVVVRYAYYSSELNAGSTWLDHRQLYVNPVNCMMYCPDLMNEEIQVQVEVPSDYRIAGGFGDVHTTISGQTAIHQLVFTDFDTLADTPFISSADLTQTSFRINGINFYIVLQGDCQPDWEKITADFFIFSNEILTMMGSYPHDEYYFLVQVLPYAFYHGVEHRNSTVIAIGPGHSLMRPYLYNEFLGVSCHELFHVWNIKHIRPAEMLPYDFSAPNYSKQGYVYEGLTTYYGDLLLLRSGVFGWAEWLQTFHEQLQKHFDNGGRKNYSVAESSFDTWLDGYVPGAPDRKVSIYTEGCLLAFMADILIRVHSSDQSNLDNVVRALWEDFGQQKIGYRAEDYRMLVERYAGTSQNHLFDDLINGTQSYEPLLRFCLEKLGLNLVRTPSNKIYERIFGFRITEGAESAISSIVGGSPADTGGLMIKDRVIGINDFEVKNNLNELVREGSDSPLHVLISRGGKLFSMVLLAGSDTETFYDLITIEKDRLAGGAERNRFYKWSGSKF